MPYSDNLYSMAEDDSDAEIEQALYQSQLQFQQEQSRHQGQDQSLYHLAGQAETPQQWNPQGLQGPQDSHHYNLPAVDLDLHMDRLEQEELEQLESTGGDADVLSPTDGYFRGDSSNTSTAPTSSHVPHVPNVWVADPSLHQSTADKKAHEAHEDRLASQGPLNTWTSDEDPPYRANASAARGTSYTHSAAATPSSSGYAQPSSHSTHSYYPNAYASTTYTPSYQYPASTSGSGPSITSGATHSRHSSTAYTPSAPASYRTYNPRRPSYGRRQSSPVPSEAPPAYTPSPTSPTSPTSSDYPRNYSTFPSPSESSRTAANMGREEAQGLLAGRPESMAHPDDDYDNLTFTPVWRERVKRRLPVFSSRTCRNILIGTVLFLIGLGFIVNFTTAMTEEKERQGAKSPATRPAPGDYMEYPEFDQDHGVPWGNNKLCKGEFIRNPPQWFGVSFDGGRGLSIVQDIQDNNHNTRDVHITGDVLVRRSSSGTPGPSISVEVVVNDKRIGVDVGWDEEQQHLLINISRSLPGFEDGPGPCVNVRVVVWVPEDASLQNLSIETIHLDIKLLDNLALKVLNQSKITSTVGSIVAASNGTDDEGLKTRGSPDTFHLDSRVIEIKTISAPIRGSWPLYDYLTLQTTSGPIQVGIEPKDSLPEDTKPAILYVKSLSGGMELYEPIEGARAAFALSQVEDQALDQTIERAEKYLPPRDYRVDLHSTSGTVKAMLAFSSTFRFHSTSGTATLELLPVLDTTYANDDGLKANMETSTTSGTNKISVLEPLWVDNAKKAYVNLGGAAIRLPTLPSGSGGLGDDMVVPPSTTIPVGRVGVSSPNMALPQVGNDNGSGKPVITGGKPSTEKREVASDLNTAANIAAQFEQEAEAQQDSAAKAWRSLISRHSSTSADTTLYYPSTWEGTINLSTLSGSLAVKGDGVRVIRYGDTWPGVKKQLDAIKGPEGGGNVNVRTTSGDIKVFVGESDSKPIFF